MTTIAQNRRSRHHLAVATSNTKRKEVAIRSRYDNDPFILAIQSQQVFYLDDYKYGPNWKVVQKVNHRHMWDVPEKDSCLEVGKDVCGGSDDEAYQDNESHLHN